MKKKSMKASKTFCLGVWGSKYKVNLSEEEMHSFDPSFPKSIRLMNEILQKMKCIYILFLNIRDTEI